MKSKLNPGEIRSYFQDTADGTVHLVDECSYEFPKLTVTRVFETQIAASEYLMKKMYEFREYEAKYWNKRKALLDGKSCPPDEI